MDLCAELESMALNAADDYDEEVNPSEEEITRWQILFGYSYSQAVEHIRAQKRDFTSCKVSSDHWSLFRSPLEAEGHSRESYEHQIQMCGQRTPSNSVSKPTNNSLSSVESSYLFLLKGILSTPQSVQDAASLSEPPRTVDGASETGEAVFCRIDGRTKQRIETWLSRQKPSFRPTFVRLSSKAKKDLAPDSIHPTLGLESTLPQHRSSMALTLPHHRGSPNHVTISPLQDEYPVWYFFYGTLADPVFLSDLLSLPDPESPVLVPASTFGGLIKTWENKYKALVDGIATDYVHGSAYEVTSREREEALLLYETENYEVVRCCITMASQTVEGLTFRFAGSLLQ